ncbi:unnamed protein product [Vitrella brassicaformis CCMP3155]|uniref:Uncharacterized protein n=1 Tax=Vitrella brassicaformis (strain CCMP3155) TaxID=1169540 RepID=A0A0G4EU88_VITBC|nr:unnamed protein product [Vitrella brassicaformis CCMP3155]|eukprot:CEM01982.1 unnamed protein product [Vitrella brassicaformis CCMP3155]
MSGAGSPPTDNSFPSTGTEAPHTTDNHWCAGLCPDVPTTTRISMTSPPSQPRLWISATRRQENANLYLFRSWRGHTRHFDLIPFSTDYVPFAQAYRQEPASKRSTRSRQPSCCVKDATAASIHPPCVPVDHRLTAVPEENWWCPTCTPHGAAIPSFVVTLDPRGCFRRPPNLYLAGEPLHAGLVTPLFSQSAISRLAVMGSMGCVDNCRWTVRLKIRQLRRLAF